MGLCKPDLHVSMLLEFDCKVKRGFNSVIVSEKSNQTIANKFMFILFIFSN